MPETVLVIGASGNIGVSAMSGALATGRNVLAVVRNRDSEERMFKYMKHVPDARERITTVEADVGHEKGVEGVVEKVKKGELPAFQHVYLTVGKLFRADGGVSKTTMDMFWECTQTHLAVNFFTYRATLPYLLSENHPNATFTLMTGAAFDYGTGITAMGQGALVGLANIGIHETVSTNVRFNEVHLSFRVDYDEVWEQKGGKDCTKASVYGKHYSDLLEAKDVKGCVVINEKPEDVAGGLRYEEKKAAVGFGVQDIRRKNAAQ